MDKQRKLNEAISFIEEAGKNGELEERFVGRDENGNWREPVGILLNASYEYRFKPRHKEWWVCWDDSDPRAVLYDLHEDIPDWDNKVKVRAVDE